MEKKIIAPSVLSADFAHMAQSIAEINESGADWIHIDVMDGRFVPNITFGAKMASVIKQHTHLPLDVHLMVEEPQNHIRAFAEAGADMITFHTEALVHGHRLAAEIHALGKKAGAAIVPSTPLSALECLLPFIDLALVMTVNPGFGGQKLIPECLAKVEKLKVMRAAAGARFLISVDGGINEDTIALAAAKGADALVTGSAFFNAHDKRAFVQNAACVQP